MKLAMTLAWLLALLGLSACTILAPPDEVKSPELGAIFGNIQIREPIRSIELREYGKFYLPPFRKTPRVLIFENGTFLAENLPAGKYYIAAVYSRFNEYSLVKDNRSAYQRIIHVKPGSLHFAGSFVIYDQPNQERFKKSLLVRKVRKPSERVLLKQLYDFTEGTGWQARVDKRLKELRVN